MSRIDAVAFRAVSRRRLLALTAGAAVAALPVWRAGAVAPRAVSNETARFLEPSVVHDISVICDQNDYDAMIQAFAQDGDKEWIEVTVTIDGSSYPRAGMRLKGNSSLGALGVAPAQIGSDEQPKVGPGGASADAPERLPWLIRLDRFVDGQRHGGFSELVIRSNPSHTALNEAVALDLLAEAGLASQLAASAGFSVNGSTRALRLAIEHPNDDWMTLRFSPDGLLYKGESTGDYSYRGEDPAAYDEVFEVEAGGTGDDGADMRLLIDFLDFLNNSDDVAFAAEITARLDTAQFAVYLAMMDLIENFDSLSGPGNNGYLYRDPASGQFTVVPWDMNLAFGSAGMLQIAEHADSPLPSGTPEAFGPSFEGERPDAEAVVIVNGRPGEGGPGGSVVFGGDRSNPLVDRFEEIASFAQAIDMETDRLRNKLYSSGLASRILAQRRGVLEAGAADMLDLATLAREAESIAKVFTRR